MLHNTPKYMHSYGVSWIKRNQSFRNDTWKCEPIPLLWNKLNEKVWRTVIVVKWNITWVMDEDNKDISLKHYDWCCYDRCYEFKNFFLGEGQIGSWDGWTLITGMGGLGGCEAAKRYCTPGDEMIVWNKTFVTEMCPYESKGTFVGKFHMGYLIVIELQSAFRITKPYNICPSLSKTYSTEQGVIVQMNFRNETKKSEFWISDPVSDRIIIKIWYNNRCLIHAIYSFVVQYTLLL